MQPRFLLASLGLGASLLLTATASAGAPVTRHLQQTVNVPAGASIAIQNLAGHMQVVQGTGPLQVDATVFADGANAKALAQSVRLDVTTQGSQVTVHVHYPIDHYDEFLYSPPTTRNTGSNEVCILGKLLCFHGTATSEFQYQGRRVRVVQASQGGRGAPLYADVVVHLPAHATAKIDNGVGLLQADSLDANLSLATQGGDIRAQSLQGQFHATSGGGDIVLGKITVSNAVVATSGGDVTASALSGDLHLSTGGGDARLDDIAGQLSVDTAGGDAKLSGNLTALKSLRASTGGGDLSVSGGHMALTSLKADSAGGDITLTNISAPSFQVHTGGGDLVGNTLNGPLAIGTAGGEVKIHSAGGTLTIASGGGDVYLSGNLAALQSLHAQTAGGELNASGNLAALASLEVASGGGNISLKASGLSLRLRAASDGGDIHVDLPDVSNVGSKSGHFSGNIGKGTGSASLDSSGGDITVTQPRP